MKKVEKDSNGIKDESTGFGIGKNVHRFTYAEADGTFGVEESGKLKDAEKHVAKLTKTATDVLNELRLARRTLHSKYRDFKCKWKQQELFFLSNQIDTLVDTLISNLNFTANKIKRHQQLLKNMPRGL